MGCAELRCAVLCLLGVALPDKLAFLQALQERFDAPLGSGRKVGMNCALVPVGCAVLCYAVLCLLGVVPADKMAFLQAFCRSGRCAAGQVGGRWAGGVMQHVCYAVLLCLCIVLLPARLAFLQALQSTWVCCSTGGQLLCMQAESPVFVVAASLA